MKKFPFVIILFLASCDTGQPSTDQGAMPIDTARQNLSTTDPLIGTNSAYKPIKNKKDLFGIWASDNKEPLIVEIKKDSIYYTEHFESHTYSLKGDSIFISYPDFMFAAKIFFNKDTLIMESENGQSKYYRFKD